MILEKLSEDFCFKIRTKQDYFKARKLTDRLDDYEHYILGQEERQKFRDCDFVISNELEQGVNIPVTRQELEQLGNEIIELAKSLVMDANTKMDIANVIDVKDKKE